MRGVRQPAVAGTFYSADSDELARWVHRLAQSHGPKRAVRAVVVPHAGYMYSGGIAGRTFAAALIPDVVIVVAVNHYGLGSAMATTSQAWQTPLGTLAVDPELVHDLLARAPFVVDDARAHAREHSLEVQLPFLQVLKGEFRFLPIQVGTHDRAQLRDLGLALAGLIGDLGEPALLVASTDLTHYQPDEVARREDRHAIARILAVDGPGLLDTVEDRCISMCGVGPTAAVLMAVRELGAREGIEVGYATSADAGGDREAVVGYVGCHIP